MNHLPIKFLPKSYREKSGGRVTKHYWLFDRVKHSVAHVSDISRYGDREQSLIGLTGFANKFAVPPPKMLI